MDLWTRRTEMTHGPSWTIGGTGLRAHQSSCSEAFSWRQNLWREDVEEEGTEGNLTVGKI
jgi:hypothetical protein